jgi:hypothetical protein
MMRRLPVSGLAAVGLCLGLAVVSIRGSNASDPSALEITTDTPQYCLRLLDRVSTLVQQSAAPPSHEVTDLSSEGQKMCDHGQTRGGIMRLRRALLILQHPQP